MGWVSLVGIIIIRSFRGPNAPPLGLGPFNWRCGVGFTAKWALRVISKSRPFSVLSKYVPESKSLNPVSKISLARGEPVTLYSIGYWPGMAA